jgi:hypothetical protein
MQSLAMGFAGNYSFLHYGLWEWQPAQQWSNASEKIPVKDPSEKSA